MSETKVIYPCRCTRQEVGANIVYSYCAVHDPYKNVVTPTSKESDPIEEALYALANFYSHRTFSLDGQDYKGVETALAAIHKEIERIGRRAIGQGGCTGDCPFLWPGMKDEHSRVCEYVKTLRKEQRARLAQALKAYKDE